LSKKGYASLEIVIELRDKQCLYAVKQKFGGSIKLRSGINHIRYRLHHKQGILNMIDAVNGLIRNPNRLLQLGKLCSKYNIVLKYPENLNYDNG
jgi:ubiquinol-cytochrome c reductase cytochrome b subunit